MTPGWKDDDPWLEECVAGLIEENETAEEVAARETLEEAGCTVSAFIPICEFYSSPGILSEFVEFYCGIVDASAGDGYHDLREEGEDIESKVVSWNEFSSHLNDSNLRDYKLQLGGYWLLANREKIRNEYASRE